MRRSGPTVALLDTLCRIFLKVMFMYTEENGMKMLWCHWAINGIKNLLQAAGVNGSPSIRPKYCILSRSIVTILKKFAYSMLYFTISYLTVKYSFDHLDFFIFFFTESMLFFFRFISNSSVCVSTWHVVFLTLHTCLDQRNNPKCKCTFRQCFAAIFERWWCFATKSAAHTSSLNQVLISHSSIQMHFISICTCLPRLFGKSGEETPSVGFVKLFHCTTLTSDDESASSFFFLFLCPGAIQILSLSSRSCDL